MNTIKLFALSTLILGTCALALQPSAAHAGNLFEKVRKKSSVVVASVRCTNMPHKCGCFSTWPRRGCVVEIPTVHDFCKPDMRLPYIVIN